MSLFYPVLAFVAAERIAELALAAANTRRLRARGAIEVDAFGYPWFVALHMAWLGSMLVAIPADRVPLGPLLGLFALLQIGRVWIIATLRGRWTTRIIALPGATLVRAGPYRWLRHPNYAVVAAEIAVLPLAFGATTVALVFTAANLTLLARRIAIEERALAPLR